MRYPLLIFVLITFGCANIKPPTGGLKDEKAPFLIKTIPKEGSLNIKPKSVEFLFNEQLKNEAVAEKIIITPLLKKPIKVIFTKNSLKIEFNEQLQDKTTYTINLADAAKDFTEGNIAKDISLTFSTGETIDSLKITGKIINMQNGLSIKDILIGLYQHSDTLNFTKEKPQYISRSNERGQFLLSSIRPGQYRILGFNDKNNNLNLEETEANGFKSQIIDVQNKNLDSIRLRISNNPITPPKIQSIENETQKTIVNFNRGLKEINVSKQDSTNFYIYLNQKGNSLTIEPKTYLTDSLKRTYNISDSLGNTNTIKLKTFILPINKRDEKPVKQKINIDPTPGPGQINNFNLFKLRINTPLKTIDTRKILIGKDSASRTETKTIYYNSLLNTIEINISEYKKDTLVIFIDSAAFISTADTNRKINYTYILKKEEDLATIKGTITSKTDENLLVQLMNEQGLIQHETKNLNYHFKFLDPGTYYIRVVKDLNKNGRFDPANFIKNQEEEPLFFYREKITVKSNFDIEDINIIVD